MKSNATSEAKKIADDVLRTAVVYGEGIDPTRMRERLKNAKILPLLPFVNEPALYCWSALVSGGPTDSVLGELSASSYAFLWVRGRAIWLDVNTALETHDDLKWTQAECSAWGHAVLEANRESQDEKR